MKLAPGTLIYVNDQPATVLVHTETRTHYVPGFHNYEQTRNENVRLFEGINLEDLTLHETGVESKV